jgi:DNA-binding MurR/RpiR family transcriptional regulator
MEYLFHLSQNGRREKDEPMNNSEAALARVPRDFDSLRSVIIERKAAMPKRLAQVAAYALSNPDDMAFGTAASIAAAADVQPSTLVRLAHHLGYEGFSDLQNVFRARLRDRTLSYEERLLSLEAGTSADSDTELLSGFINAASQSLSRLAGTIDGRTFSKSVDLLARAETIYLVAKRRSYPLTAHIAYAFGKLGIRHQIIASPNGIDAEIAGFATEKDAVIAASFAPYAAESLAQAQELAARGVPIVAITDSVFSPLAAAATHWLEVSEADYAGFRSLSASMALAMALPVAIAECRRSLKRAAPHRATE